MSHKQKNKALCSSNEMFFMKDGIKQDAALHEEILAEGDARSRTVKNERFSDNPFVQFIGPDGKEIPMSDIIKKA